MPIFNVGGTLYPYPNVGDKPWGTIHIAWAAAVSSLATTLNTQVTNIIAAQFIDPMIVDGDMIFRTGGIPERLPIGTDGQVLAVVAGLPAWTTVAGTGDVVGPAGAVDNALTVFDGTTGKLIKETTVNVDALGNFVGINDMQIGGVVTAAADVNIAGAVTAASTDATTANAFFDTYTRTVGTTVGIRGLMRTGSSGNFVTGSGSEVNVTNLNGTITSTGRPIMIVVTPNVNTLGYIGARGDNTANTATGWFRLYRDGTFVSGYQLSLTKEDPAADVSISTGGPLIFFDITGAGTWTYQLTAQASTSVREAQVNDCRMLAFEL